MIAQFSIVPVGAAHFSPDLKETTRILERSGLEYQVGPIGTCLKGDWGDVLNAIETCHRTVAERHGRVVTTIILDDRRGDEHTLRGAVEAVHEDDGGGEVRVEAAPPSLSAEA
jgi:uncharacterized protein (TIGR00106 family)